MDSLSVRELVLVALVFAHLACSGAYAETLRHSAAERGQAATTVSAATVAVFAAAVEWERLTLGYVALTWLWVGQSADKSGPTLYGHPHRPLGDLAIEVLWRLAEAWP